MESEGLQIYGLNKLWECIKKISGRYISGLNKIKHGVPQGSELGRILYLLDIYNL